MNDISTFLPYTAGTVLNDVLVGLDGNLFLHQGGHRQFDNLLGKVKPTPISVNNFADNVSSRKEYCEALGIEYRHIIFPSKPLVKKEFLTDPYSLVESVYEKSYLPGLPSKVIDTTLHPLQFLRELELSGLSTFKKYDTHMTDFANLEVAKLLTKPYSPTGTADWALSEVSSGGDLSKMLGKDLKNPEKTLSPANFKVQFFGNRNFLPSNGNEIFIAKRLDSAKLPRLLIFGDSFFKDMIPFLSGLYSTVIYFRSQFFHKDIVDSIRPDVVFTGNAERYLHVVESDREASNILYELYGLAGYVPDFGFLNALKAELSYFYYPEKYKKYSSQDNVATFDGRVESFNGKTLTGWCIDSSVSIPKIDVVRNGVLVKRVQCSKERTDVIKKHGSINILNGFSFDTGGTRPSEYEFYVTGKNVKLRPAASLDLSSL